MTHMLELSNRGFKISMINILRALMEKIDNMQKHMDNVSREMGLLRIELKGNTRKNLKSSNRNEGLFSRLSTTKERIHELENRSYVNTIFQIFQR